MEPARGGPAGAGLAEALAVWALFGVFTLAVLVTYWRVPPEHLFAVALAVHHTFWRRGRLGR